MDAENQHTKSTRHVGVGRHPDLPTVRLTVTTLRLAMVKLGVKTNLALPACVRVWVRVWVTVELGFELGFELG